MSAQDSPRETSSLRGRLLLAARASWIVAAVFYAGLCIASVVVTYVAYPKICGSPNPAALCVNLGPVDGTNVQSLGLSLRSYTAYTLALDAVHMLGFWALGVVIFWKKSDSRIALFVSLTLLLLGSSENHLVDTLFQNYPVWGLPVGITDVAGWVLLYILFFIFPDGRFVPRWTRWLCAAGLLYLSYLLLFSTSVSDFAITLAIFVLGGGAIVAQFYRYIRVSGPIERQQAKFVMVAGMVVVGWQLSRPIFEPFLLPRFSLAVDAVNYVSLLLVPVSIALAILRYRLWDIDFFINRAMIYSTLTVVLGFVYFGGVTLLQGMLRGPIGEDSQLAVVASTLGIASLFEPLRRRVHTVIDRLFYRRKYNARKTLEAFSTKLRDETDLEALRGDLVEVVKETMQPANVSLWLRPDTASKREQGD
jgi:hypothetical protein